MARAESPQHGSGDAPARAVRVLLERLAQALLDLGRRTEQGAQRRERRAVHPQVAVAARRERVARRAPDGAHRIAERRNEGIDQQDFGRVGCGGEAGVGPSSSRRRSRASSGIRTADGVLYEPVVLVLATGFRPDRFIRPTTTVIGREGGKLDELWNRRPTAYLSVTSPGLPKLHGLDARGVELLGHGLSGSHFA